MILTYLDISNGHLTEETFNLLGNMDGRDRYDRNWPAMSVATYEGGVFITVPSMPDVYDQLANVPDDLIQVLWHAHYAGATLVRLDMDGDVLHAIPYYEW